MNRKYRQPGYQSGQNEKSENNRSAPRKSFRDGPRSPRMMNFQKTFRCAMCGTTLPATVTEIDVSTRCPNCAADLHTCKHCVYFDPSSRFECTQPVRERVVKKDESNMCPEFEARTTVEKATSSVRETRPSALDPREAFERLFKK